MTPKTGQRTSSSACIIGMTPVNDPDKAVNEFNQAIQHGFATDDVYWARANANRYREVPDADVLQDFERALDLAPGQ